MICIPLFLMISGYLLANKEPPVGYFKKIFRILIEYLIASICCTIFTALYYNEFNLINCFRGIFTFKCVPYSWYINMYIGLFLLAPFINKIFVYTPKKQQQLFLLIMIILTILPSVINYYHSVNQFAIFALPSFWSNSLYYFTYFFTGMYIKINKPQYKKWILLIILVFNLAIESLLSLKVFGNIYDVPNEALTFYNTIFVFITATCIFLMFYNLEYKPNRYSKTITIISNATLSAYMISWVFDRLVYEPIDLQYWSYTKRFLLSPLTILAVAILSIIYGIIVTQLISAIKKLSNYYRKNKPIKNQQE